MEILIMNRKMAILYIAIFGVVISILGFGVFSGLFKLLFLPKSKVLPIEDIVPKNITVELSKMEDWEKKIEEPKDKEMLSHLQNALDTVRQAWSECQQLVNSRQVKIYCWNRQYRANWKSDNKKETIFLVFRSEKGEIRQCLKRVFADETHETEIKEKGYQFKFYDNNDYLEWHHRRDGNEGVHFYPNNKIESFWYRSADGSRYLVEWDEDGKIIKERMR